MVKANLLQTSNKENVECYTPQYLVDFIIEYLPKNKTIWCPFSLPDHYFGNYLRSKGYTVINSSILTGEDFFKWQPQKWDLILDNPPFKDKVKFYKRALSFNKPFALLLPLTALHDRGIPMLHLQNDLELLIPANARPEFIRVNDPNRTQRVSFKVAYFCHQLLPKQLIFKEIDKAKITEDEHSKFINVLSKLKKDQEDQAPADKDIKTSLTKQQALF